MAQISINTRAFLEDRWNAISEGVQLVYSSAVEGDIAEFGIFQGISIRVMALTMAMLDNENKQHITMPQKHLHGFDSFKGLPRATLSGDIDSPMVAMGAWAEGTCPSPGEAVIRSKLEAILPAERVHLYPGWFVDTLPTQAPETKYAIVHLDCDLYESTIQVLDDLFLNKRLADGSILMFDDFLENRSSKKHGQRKAWEECKSKYAPDFTDFGFYGKGCWRCIIHTDT